MLRVLLPLAVVLSAAGVISVEIRVGVALRLLAGASYCDVSLECRLGRSTVFYILWQVIDAINKTDGTGPFFFPQTPAECRTNADVFQACDVSCYREVQLSVMCLCQRFRLARA